MSVKFDTTLAGPGHVMLLLQFVVVSPVLQRMPAIGMALRTGHEAPPQLMKTDGASPGPQSM